jgi:homopolymeric O-antigen transport system permease protein
MISSWGTVLARRDLVRELMWGELKSTSAETKLGYLWWLLDPVLMMMIYWFFIVLLFGRKQYAPYPVFIGCALLPWRHLTASTGGAVRVLRAREALIKSVPFPTLALPVSLVLTQTVYFVASFAALLLIALGFGQPMTWQLLQVPPLIILETLLVLGMSMAIACWGVLLRDLDSFLQHALRIGWYLSPGIYGVDLFLNHFKMAKSSLAGRLFTEVFMGNPFAILFTGYRGAIFAPEWLAPKYWIELTVETAIVLACGYAVYRHYDRRVIKYI